MEIKGNEQLVKVVREQDPEWPDADLMQYAVLVDGERAGMVRRSKSRPIQSGIGMTYYPWEGWSAHRELPSRRSFNESRKQGVAWVVAQHQAVKKAAMA